MTFKDSVVQNASVDRLPCSVLLSHVSVTSHIINAMMVNLLQALAN